MNAPATTNPPTYNPTIALLCISIRPVRAAQTPTGNITSVNTDNPWIQENRPGPATSVIAKLETATPTITTTQTRPSSRCPRPLRRHELHNPQHERHQSRQRMKLHRHRRHHHRLPRHPPTPCQNHRMRAYPPP